MKNIVKERIYSNVKVSFCLSTGIFPYSYLDCNEKLNDDRLPGPEAFKNDITGEEVDPLDYERAQTVWRVFEINTMREYLDLYMKVNRYKSVKKSVKKCEHLNVFQVFMFLFFTL